MEGVREGKEGKRVRMGGRVIFSATPPLIPNPSRRRLIVINKDGSLVFNSM